MSARSASGGDRAGERAGLFFCRCAENLGRIVGVDDLAVPERWPQAACVGVHDVLCAPEGLAWLRDRIREEGLERVVIGACSPREHEETFRDAAEAAGLSRWKVQLVNLREQVEWIGGDRETATVRAERLVRAGLARAALHRDLPHREVEASPDVVVIGAGAAGLSAARALAGRGRRVALVERQFALGGLANQLDEVSPDGVCASCFMAPAIDDVLHHPAIDVLTGAEVTEVRGSLGRFELTVASRPRYVDAETCLGCPACIDACPVERPDAAEGGLGTRRAIQLPYAGCLPFVPAIDPDACAGLGGGSCRACVDACAVGAIRLDDRPGTRTLHAGAIVLATGLRPGEVGGPPGVISTWRLERMLHPNGPTGGALRGAGGGPPRAVLLAPAPQAAAADGDLAIETLLKLARIVRHRFPTVRVQLAGGLGASPRHAARVQALAAAGVEPIAADWVEGGVSAAGGRLHVRLRDGAGERTEEVDLLVVHGASRPADGADRLAAHLRIGRRADGFLDDAGPSPFEPTATCAPGVFVAGAAAGPRPLRAAIRDGAAVAGRILGALQPGEKLTVEPLAAEVDELRCCGCGACVASCAFGAVRRDPASGKARVEPLHCRACGSCAAGCPTGAMRAPHYTREQLAAEITALLATEGAP